MTKKIAVFLSTIDNPFDPYKDYDEWKRFDQEKGYNSSSYLARLANTSIHLSEKEFIEEVEKAVDRICYLDPIGLYKKVVIYE
jgi:hypothetical protein